MAGADGGLISVMLFERKEFHLGRELTRAFSGLTGQEARHTATRVRTNIRGQKYGHVPLRPATVAFKALRGRDPRILISSAAYVNSITATKQKSGREEQWLVAPRLGARTANGHSMRTLGLWLEFGTAGMPARPHYRPEVEVTRRRLVNVSRRRLQGIVRKWERQPINVVIKTL